MRQYSLHLLFDNQVDFMARLGSTWVEAGKARDILLSLRLEYHPADKAEQAAPGAVVPPVGLDEWLINSDLWGLFPESIFPWNGEMEA